MSPTTIETVCLHCEERPRSTSPRDKHLRLCAQCAAVPGLRVVYHRTRDWTRERERRIQALVERAKAGLPLFPEGAG